MAVLLYRLNDSPDAAQLMTFIDVDESSWYGPAVRWMSRSGVTTGVDADHFAPHDSVTRCQGAAFLERFANRTDWRPRWRGNGGHTGS